MATTNRGEIAMKKIVKLAMNAALLGMTLSCQPMQGIDEVDQPKKSVGRRMADPLPPPPENASVETPVETLNAPASLVVMSTEQSVRDQLTPLTAIVNGGNVQFVDCTATPSCLARVDARTLPGLRDLLQSVGDRMNTGITFVARERYDAYRGHFFQADVTIGAARMGVPSDPNELIVNFGDPPDPEQELLQPEQ